MSDPLEDVRSRFMRAQIHMHTVTKAVERLTAIGASAIRRETNADGSVHSYYAVEPLALQTSTALETSECLHNLRSCLDNLVYRMAELNMRRLGKPVPEDARLFAFPICLTKSEFLRRQKTALAHTDKDTKKLVRSFQPYVEGAPDESSLWHLSQLQNIDKHRYLTRLALSSQVWRHEMAAGHTVDMALGPGFVGDGRPEENALIARFTVDPPSVSLDLHFGPMLNVVLNDGPGSELLNTLGAMTMAVRRVLNAASHLPLVAAN